MLCLSDFELYSRWVPLNSAHLNVLKTSRTKLIINGTSIQRQANGLAKFARFNEVSLYRGSFSYTLLLLG